MKAVLKRKDGFFKYMEVPKDRQVFEMLEMNNIDLTKPFEPTATVPYFRRTFYFERSFINEFNEEIAIYEEHP